jgi:hypothetical protein
MIFVRDYYRKSQTTFDYVVFFCVIIAAVLIIGQYVRNTLAGKWRDAADSIGKGGVYSSGRTQVTETIENQ